MYIRGITLNCPQLKGYNLYNRGTKTKNMAERAGYEIVVLFTFVVCGAWLVFHSQFKAPAEPGDAGGETGFSKVPAMNHVKAAALVCGRDKWFDFVTFSVTYSCWTEPTTKIPGWNKTQIPALRVGSHDFEGVDDNTATLIHINTAGSTRWSLSVNTNEIQDFQLQDDSGALVSGGEKKSIDGWHLLHFAGGNNWATKFDMTLHWQKNSSALEGSKGGNVLLLKLRTHNVNATTLEMDKVLKNLPFLVFSIWELHFTTYFSLLGYFVCYFCFRAFVENGDFISFSSKCVIVSPLDCD